MYLLFSGGDYSEKGGWNDFIGGYETLEDAKNALEIQTDIWAHIVDTNTMTVVLNFYSETAQYDAAWSLDGRDRKEKQEYIDNAKRFRKLIFSSSKVNGKYEYADASNN